jgi:hypothetical protein
MGEMNNVYTILVGNPEGKTPVYRPNRRWEEEIVCEDVNFVNTTQNRQEWVALVNTVIVLRVI